MKAEEATEETVTLHFQNQIKQPFFALAFSSRFSGNSDPSPAVHTGWFSFNLIRAMSTPSLCWLPAFSFSPKRRKYTTSVRKTTPTPSGRVGKKPLEWSLLGSGKKTYNVMFKCQSLNLLTLKQRLVYKIELGAGLCVSWPDQSHPLFKWGHSTVNRVKKIATDLVNMSNGNDKQNCGRHGNRFGCCKTK